MLQVLLLSIVMSLLLMRSSTPREASWFCERVGTAVQADLMIHSAKSEALFVRLVNPGSFDRSGIAGPSTASRELETLRPSVI